MVVGPITEELITFEQIQRTCDKYGETSRKDSHIERKNFQMDLEMPRLIK